MGRGASHNGVLWWLVAVIHGYCVAISCSVYLWFQPANIKNIWQHHRKCFIYSYQCDPSHSTLGLRPQCLHDLTHGEAISKKNRKCATSLYPEKAHPMKLTQYHCKHLVISASPTRILDAVRATLNTLPSIHSRCQHTSNCLSNFYESFTDAFSLKLNCRWRMCTH